MISRRTRRRVSRWRIRWRSKKCSPDCAPLHPGYVLSIFRNYDLYLVRLDATELDGEWRRGEIELYALADALAAHCAAEGGGLHCLTGLRDVDPAFRRQGDLVAAGLCRRRRLEKTGKAVGRFRRPLRRRRQFGVGERHQRDDRGKGDRKRHA